MKSVKNDAALGDDGVEVEVIKNEPTKSIEFKPNQHESNNVLMILIRKKDILYTSLPRSIVWKFH